MAPRKLILFAIILAFSKTASAVSLPNAGSLNDSTQGSETSGLIENASISEFDDRGPITSKAKDIGFTPHDVQHIRAAHGYINCPGSYSKEELEANKKISGKLPPPKNSSLMSATILEADDQIVTNRHAFIDSDTGKPRDPLSKCVFQNQLPHYSVRLLQLNDGQAGIDQAIAMGLLKFGDLADDNADRAVVKMTSSIPGVKAFKISRSDIELHGCNGILNCQTIVAVSAYQLRLPVPVSPFEPIAQSGVIRNVYGPLAGRGAIILTNLSATKGASGSINFLKDINGKFLRDSDGELMPIAIFVRDSFEKMDHMPYSLTPMNATKSLVLDYDAAVDIFGMAKGFVREAPRQRKPAP